MTSDLRDAIRAEAFLEAAAFCRDFADAIRSSGELARRERRAARRCAVAIESFIEAPARSL